MKLITAIIAAAITSLVSDIRTTWSNAKSAVKAFRDPERKISKKAVILTAILISIGMSCLTRITNVLFGFMPDIILSAVAYLVPVLTVKTLANLEVESDSETLARIRRIAGAMADASIPALCLCSILGFTFDRLAVMLLVLVLNGSLLEFQQIKTAIQTGLKVATESVKAANVKKSENA